MLDDGDSHASMENLSKLEEALLAVPDDGLPDNTYHAARRAAGNYLLALSGPTSSSASLPDLIERASRLPNAEAVRNAAVVVARLVYRDALLPAPDGANKLKLRVVALFEKGVKDIADKMGISKVSQTFEKYDIIRQLHPQICSELEPLRSLATAEATHEMLLATRSAVSKVLGKDLISAYLGPWDIKRLRTAFTFIYSELQASASLTDATFITRVLALQAFVEGELKWCDQFPTFLSRDYFRPALESFEIALNHIASAAKDRFVCQISTKRPCPAAAEKRYPLHEVGRMVRMIIPMRNEGPGVAVDLQCAVSVEEEAVQFDASLFLGDIKPGDFALALLVMVERPLSEIVMALDLTWSEAGHSERRQASFPIRISAQAKDVDWEALKTAQPYTPEVAEGDEFVGRVVRVSSIAGRFRLPRMNSCYITGQKRVGKTSLAKAVGANLEKTSKNFKVHYLEYGSYCAMDSVNTVHALGEALFDALQSQRRGAGAAPRPNFHGTIAPLIRVAEAIAKEEPNLRFVFILDEFDEIAPDMYRYGPLAEAFFANLRALSSKANVAFLLVGGEKMPFVMSAQGDQLNKFTGEPLDYFSTTDEWLDYQDLVRRPVEGRVTWDDSAVQAISLLTNGHPFYTKLLCANAFHAAVAERDAYLTAADVHNSAKRLVSALESNAFAHLWKDGISDADPERAEVIELNRRRTLCACSRALRSGKALTPETVFAANAGLRINQTNVTLMLQDFARRGIVIERDGQYTFAVPLFEMWLRDHGAAKLLSDALAEEYEANLEREQDAARVSAAEIVHLVAGWDAYRGMPVTDESVRGWIEQASDTRDQRLLFRILQNLRFVSRLELRAGMKTAHSFLTGLIPPHHSMKRTDRRKDILVTWVDGAGKSGNSMAALYTEENRIQQKSLLSPEGITAALALVKEPGQIAAIVIVDDIVGTGDSLSKNLQAFLEKNGPEIRRLNMRVLVTAYTATNDGEHAVRESLKDAEIEIDFRVIDPMAAQVAAFTSGGRVLWADDEERGRAKELCQRLGNRVHRNNPLGYGDQGLLLVFPDACPNNSLPILHGSASGKEPWRPLFERPKH